MEIYVNNQPIGNAFIQLVRLSDKYQGYGDGIGIILDGKRILYYYKRRSSWEVVGTCDQNTIKSCELTPCTKDDLRIGDTVFLSNKSDIADFHFTNQYCKVIEKESVVSSNANRGISISSVTEWKYLYKVNQKD